MIGYNIAEAMKVAEEIRDKYREVGNKLAQRYAIVALTLSNEWKGVDELDYEQKLCLRIRELYKTTYDLAKDASQNIINIANAWVEFQKKNVLSENEEGGVAKFAHLAKTASEIEFKWTGYPLDLSFSPREFSANENLGLQSAKSAATIIGEIDDFAKTVKQIAQDFFNEIDAGKAFMGDTQSTAIKNYLKKVGEVVGDVTTAINNIKKAVTSLAEGYNKAMTEVQTKISEAVKGEIDFGDSKWSEG